MNIICPKCGSENNKIINTNKKGSPKYRYKCLDCPKIFNKSREIDKTIFFKMSKELNKRNQKI